MRVLKIIALTLTFLLVWSLWVAEAKGRKVRVYMHAPDMGYTESFSYQLQEAMRVADEEDNSYEFVWVQAKDADFVITVVVDKNKLPVVIKAPGNSYNMCYQTISVIHLWSRQAKESTGMLNMQLDCDIAEMADRAVVELERAMGLKEVAHN